MKNTISKFLLACCLGLLGTITKAQGLENVIVEDYYTVTAADEAFYAGAAGAGTYPLLAGMKCYRIYIDMAPGYKLLQVWGTPDLPGGGPSPNKLDITTNTTFWNDDNFGSELPGQTRRLDEGNAFDSYITMNRSAAGSTGTAGCGSLLEQFGVLKTADTDANLTMCAVYSGFPLGSPDGNMPGTSGPLTYDIGATTDFSALTTDGNSFQMVNEFWATLPASQGVDPTGTNRILIAQVTTSGSLSFHLNVQLSSPSSQIESYVWNQVQQAGDVVSPLLTYPVPCTPVQITGTSSNSPICATDPLSLGVTATGTAPISYLWTGTGTFNPNNASANVTVTGAATGNYNIAVSNACGNVNQNVAVTVNTPTTWYGDGDGDGAGDPGVTQQACAQPNGFVSNNNDQCPTDPNKIAPGICGCGVADTDSDGDGVPNCNDLCPGGPEPGTACNDNNACTINDVITAGCTCAGTPDNTDTDGDGVPNCSDNCPTVPGQQGSACDDGNALTINDVLNANCQCVGTPVSCVVNGDCNDNDACTSDACVANSCVYTPITTDTDGDGTPDCSDNCPTVPGQQGSSCDDGNALTINDVLNANCICAGTPVSCVVAGDCNDNDACTSDACVNNACVYTPLTTDTDGDGTPDCADNCPTVPGQQGSACDDGNALTINDVLNANCQCVGTPVSCTVNGDCNDNDACTSDACVNNACVYTPLTTDTDGDGTPDCSDNCPTVPGQQGSACSDGDPCTINDVLNANCQCAGTLDNTDTDGDGVPNCSDNCPTVPGQQGSACDDGNALTINDVLNANCQCVGTPVSCTVNGDCNDNDACTSDACVNNACVYTPLTTDTDGDGTPDCADNCPTVPGQQGSACDDGNALTVNDQLNANCQCVGTPVSCTVNGDCNDNDDCTSDACVNNACVYTPLPDGDSDGICDAQDDCPNTPGEIGSPCDDSNSGTINDVVNASCVCVGTPVNCTEILNLDITLDNSGSQTTVELRDQTGTVVLDQAGPFADNIGGQTVSHQFCVNPGCYRLYVYDSGGNGISGGGYVLRDANNKRIIDANGLFGSVSSVAGEFCVAIGNTTVKPNWCDRTNFIRTDFIYCLGVPGSAGYQWWFFDPHGSYSRTIFIAGSTGVRFSQMVTNPIPLDMDLNVRVRSKVGGVYQAFGPTCRVRVNTSAPAMQDGQYHMGFEQEASTFTLYPNPSRHEAVYVIIDGLSDEAKPVNIEVFDIFGKKVHAEAFTLEGSELNHVMDLSGDLATGMYVVNVTVGDQAFTKRLIRE